MIWVTAQALPNDVPESRCLPKSSCLPIGLTGSPAKMPNNPIRATSGGAGERTDKRLQMIPTRTTFHDMRLGARLGTRTLLRTTK